MIMKNCRFVLILILISAEGVSAQPAEYIHDSKSSEAIITALYAVISGEAKAPRDWARFRNLFKPESRMIPTRKGEGGGLDVKSLTAEEYITLYTSRVTTGFFERELHHVTETYGTVTHVFSTYETKEKKEGPVTNRGINSIQLFHDGQRYYIVTVFWCAESMGFPLPEKYIK